jgi:hypothetical protein
MYCALHAPLISVPIDAVKRPSFDFRVGDKVRGMHSDEVGTVVESLSSSLGLNRRVIVKYPSKDVVLTYFNEGIIFLRHATECAFKVGDRVRCLNHIEVGTVVNAPRRQDGSDGDWVVDVDYESCNTVHLAKDLVLIETRDVMSAFGEAAQTLQHVASNVEDEETKVVPIMQLPGKYAWHEKVGNYERTVTFQTLDEMKAYVEATRKSNDVTLERWAGS